MAEFRYVEMPEKSLTGAQERQAAVDVMLSTYVAAGWEPISIADSGRIGTIGVLLRRG